MRKLLLLFFLYNSVSLAQQTVIKGSVIDAVSFSSVINTTILVEGTKLKTQTNELGVFILTGNIPLGEQVLKISKPEYITKRYPVIIYKNRTLNLTDITLEREDVSSENLFTIMISDDELNDDTSSGSDNISGLLASSLDVFQRTAAFEFSTSFFKVRGLDSNNATILINGISMNKLYNGRPQWSNWGGLNDVLRNQEFTTGLTPSNYTFGGALGTTNINVRASQARPGARFTYSSSNRSYANRLIASYASGLLKNKWAYTISLGKRWGNEGYQDATLYDSNSFFVSAEKVFSEKHSISFTGIYSPNKRGKSSPNTQEVYNLKGITYNEYWGWQDGKKRNSRIKEVEEPILLLNHDWTINNKTTVNTNVGYQFGTLGNSRLDYNGTNLVNGSFEGGGVNPSPTYYQKLPSFFERNYPDKLEFAYQAQKAFLKEGQINWNKMYEANIASASKGKNAIYALYEDRVDDKQLTVNSIFNYEFNEHIIFNGGFDYKYLESENYAKVLDLLGANSYLDIDGFSATNIDTAQNDLLNPNKIVANGDRFKYNYNLFANVLNGFLQAQFKYNNIDFYTAASVNNTKYQREGMYQNGAFPNNSLGKGKVLPFLGLGFKGGLTYKITGKHIFNTNAGYIARAPTIQNTFSNSRENHNVVPNITNEKIRSLDINYVFRSSYVKSKLTGYYTNISDANEIAFFFADGIGGDNAAFVQEILQGIEKQHIGLELGLEAQILPTVKIKGVTSVGQYTYNNNPKLFLTTQANKDSEDAGFINGFKDFGTASLKNYKLATGPQRAYSCGFEYRDPNYWWFGTTVNYFTNTYIDISPLIRSSNFITDYDGNIFTDYDENIARTLLKQERFDDYVTVNLVGGKSWIINRRYISIFVSINNLLDKVYKTGGFEQARNANYRQLRDDKALEVPVFGSKYWYGRGSTYFLNLNIRL